MSDLQYQTEVLLQAGFESKLCWSPGQCLRLLSVPQGTSEGKDGAPCRGWKGLRVGGAGRHLLRAEGAWGLAVGHMRVRNWRPTMDLAPPHGAMKSLPAPDAQSPGSRAEPFSLSQTAAHIPLLPAGILKAVKY